MKAKYILSPIFSSLMAVFILSIPLIFTGCGEPPEEISPSVSVKETDGDKQIAIQQYHTLDIDEKRDFPEKVRIDGMDYELKKVDYEILKEYPAAENIVTDSTDIMYEKDFYDPDQEITINGADYTLSEVSKNYVGNIYTQNVTYYHDYDHSVEEEDVPKMLMVSVKNERTGEDETAPCFLVGIEDIRNTWVNTYIDITYQEYDADVFVWGNSRVEKNESSPDLDKTQLLASVGADTSTHRVGDIYWIGQPYYNGDVLCRDARADVWRLVDWHRANYEGVISMEGVEYTSTYVLNNPEDGQNSYDMQATATYEVYKAKIPVAIVAAGVGIAVVVILAITILFIIAKKKKNENKV